MLRERRFVDGKCVWEGKGEVLIAGAACEQMGGKTGSLLQTPGCLGKGAILDRGKSSSNATSPLRLFIGHSFILISLARFQQHKHREHQSTLVPLLVPNWLSNNSITQDDSPVLLNIFPGPCISRCRVLSYVKNACTMEPCFSHAKASRGRHRTMAIEPCLLFLVNRCILFFRNRIVFSDYQMEARLW